MKNKKGFTLVELLAAMVILGLIMAIAIPNIMGVLKSNKDKIYVEDAKRLSALAEYKFKGDSTIVKPTEIYQCTVLPLSYLDNGEFEKAPDGKPYDKNKSFVTIKKEDAKYIYYVTLADSSNKGIEYKKTDELNINKPSDLITQNVSITYNHATVSGKCTCTVNNACY